MKKRHLRQANETEVAIMYSLSEIQASLDHCMMSLSGQDKAGSTPWAAALALYYTAKHQAHKLRRISKIGRFPHRPRHLSVFNLNRTFMRTLYRLDVEEELLPFIESPDLLDIFSYKGEELDTELLEEAGMSFDRAWTPEKSPAHDPLKGNSDTVKFSALVTTFLKCAVLSMNPVEQMVEDGAGVRQEMVTSFRERWSAVG